MSTHTSYADWKDLDPDQNLQKKSPTAGMAGMVEMWPSRGVEDGIDAAQGAELALEQDDPIYQAINDPQPLETGPYNSGTGGEKLTREQTAHYFANTYRVPATLSNTFLVQALGRTGVFIAGFQEMAYQQTQKIIQRKVGVHKPLVLLSKDHWKTLSDSAESCGLTVKTFDSRNPDPAEAILAALDEVDPRHVGGILLNYPLNPLSTEISVEQMKRIVDKVSELNRQDNVNIQLLFDIPYTFACQMMTDDKGRFLNSGFQHVLDDIDNVDYSIVNSFSKFFSLARTGATAIVVNQERAAGLEKRLGDFGPGVARNNTYIRNVANLLGGDHDDLLWARSEAVGDRYGGTRELLVDTFGDEIINGGSGMLALQERSVHMLFNRVVTSSDGQDRLITNGDHVVTHLWDKHHVALVNCGVQNEKLGIRYAGRNELPVAEQLVQRVKTALDEIDNAPTVHI